jgi:hypothetical protein
MKKGLAPPFAHTITKFSPKHQPVTTVAPTQCQEPPGIWVHSHTADTERGPCADNCNCSEVIRSYRLRQPEPAHAIHPVCCANGGRSIRRE